MSQEEHNHKLRRFNCLESSEDDFPRVLHVCFGCGQIFTQEVRYNKVELTIK